MIAWASYFGEAVEQVIVAYICLQFPSSVHIRPSQGDGGIDVIRSLDDGSWAVYQIERFSNNLGASQKKQIAKSWNSVIKYSKEKSFSLKEWYLVMPLDPTKENLEWFSRLTGDSEIEASWLGKTHVDGWAAEMPYVTDYYLRDNRDAVLSIVKNMLGVAYSNVADIDGLANQANKIQSLLNDLDPNYAYDLQILSDYNKASVIPFSSRPGLVMSTIMETDDRRVIQIDVLAKHNASTDLAPITGKVNFHIGDNAQSKTLQELIDYGVPITDFPASVITNGPILFGGQGELEEAIVTTYSCSEETVFNMAIHNKVDSAMDVIQSSFTKGRKGAIWSGSTLDQMFSIKMKTLYSDSSAKINIAYNQNYFTQYPVSKICKKLRFLIDGVDDEFSITLAEDELCRFSLELLGIKKEEIKFAQKVAELLALVDAVALEGVDFPSRISREEFNNLTRAVELIQGKQIVQCWEKLEPDSIDNSIESGSVGMKPFAIRFLLNRSLTLENKHYHYGYVNHEMVGTWSKDQNILVPTTEYGNEVRMTYVGSVNDTEMRPGRLYIAPLRDVAFLGGNIKNG